MKWIDDGTASLKRSDVGVLISLDGATLDKLEENCAPFQQAKRAPTNTTCDEVPSLPAGPQDDVACGIDEPTNWAEAAARSVRALARLHENWDGRDGLPPSPDVLETVWLLLEHLEDTVVDLGTPIVLPVPDGSVQFEWTSGGKHVEFRALSSDSILCLHEEEKDSAIEMGVDELELDGLGIETIRKRLLWLSAA